MKKSFITLMNCFFLLFTPTEASLEIDALHEGVDFYAKITRARFEEMNMVRLSIEK